MKTNLKLFGRFLLGVSLILVFATNCKKNDKDNNPQDPPDSVTDIDGNVYTTVKIGELVWTGQNLKTTRYRNGDLIGSKNSLKISGGMCWDYQNDPLNSMVYGKLYNFYAVADERGLAPEGWHVSTDDDWLALNTTLGGAAVSGGKLKEAGTGHWASPNTAATNESGFTALPGGIYTINGSFLGLTKGAYFWTSTKVNSWDAWDRELYYKHGEIHRNPGMMGEGYSVRLVKD